MDRPCFFRTLRKNKLPYRGGGGKKMQATTDCYRRIFCVWKFLWFLVCENQNPWSNRLMEVSLKWWHDACGSDTQILCNIHGTWDQIWMSECDTESWRKRVEDDVWRKTTGVWATLSFCSDCTNGQLMLRHISSSWAPKLSFPTRPWTLATSHKVLPLD